MSFSYHEYRTVKVSAYSFSMNAPMLEAFRLFASKYRATGKPVPKRELTFGSNSQYTNWQTLQYFGIIEREGAVWKLTEKGDQFYQGKIPIISPCCHMGGETLGDEHPAWQTFKGKRRPIWISDDLATKQKEQRHYTKEKRGDVLFSDPVMDKITHATKRAAMKNVAIQESIFDQNVTEAVTLR